MQGLQLGRITINTLNCTSSKSLIQKRSCEFKSYEGYIVLVRFTYNEDNNVIIVVVGSASQMRGFEYFPRQAIVSWVQTNASKKKFGVLKISNEQKRASCLNTTRVTEQMPV